MKKIKEPRRIKYGLDYEKAAMLRAQCYDACHFANKRIIPAMQALSFDVNLEKVVRYTADPEQMHHDFITDQMRENASGNKALDMMLIDKFAKEAAAIAPIPARGEAIVNPDYYHLEKEEDEEQPRLCYDPQKVKAAAEIWITDPDELEVYDRHQTAVKALNELFNGHAPENWNDSLSGYFGTNNGEIFAVIKPSYKRFIK